MSQTWDPDTFYSRGAVVYYQDYLYINIGPYSKGKNPKTATFEDAIPFGSGATITRRQWLPEAGTEINTLRVLGGDFYGWDLPIHLQLQRGAGHYLDPDIENGGPPIEGQSGTPAKGVFLYIQHALGAAQYYRKVKPGPIAPGTIDKRYWDVTPKNSPNGFIGEYDANNGYSVTFTGSDDQVAYTLSSDYFFGPQTKNSTTPDDFNLSYDILNPAPGYKLVVIKTGPGDMPQTGMFQTSFPYIGGFMGFLTMYQKQFKYRVKTEKRTRSVDPFSPGGYTPWGPWNPDETREGTVSTGANWQTAQPTEKEEKFFYDPVLEEIRVKTGVDDEGLPETGHLELMGKLLDPSL